MPVRVPATEPQIASTSFAALKSVNAVEGFFSALTRKRLKRGVFHSVVDLQAAINRYVEQHNHDPKPFVWTKSSETILAKIDRLPVPSE